GDAVEYWHVDVHDHQVRTMLGGQFKSFESISADPNDLDVEKHLQEFTDHDAEICGVIDDHDTNGLVKLNSRRAIRRRRSDGTAVLHCSPPVKKTLRVNRKRLRVGEAVVKIPKSERRCRTFVLLYFPNASLQVAQFSSQSSYDCSSGRRSRIRPLFR